MLSSAADLYTSVLLSAVKFDTLVLFSVAAKFCTLEIFSVAKLTSQCFSIAKLYTAVLFSVAKLTLILQSYFLLLNCTL